MRLVACLLAFAACSDRESRSDRPAPTRSTEPARPPARMCEPKARTACAGDDVVECNEDRTHGHKLLACKGGCKLGACIDTCAVTGVELIYVVDHDSNFLRFDPAKLPDDPFQLVGKLSCGSASTPFSMAVDRGGIAWVLHATGKVYRVSIVDAHCSAVGHVPVGAPRTFGMGFVTDGPKATTEKLFVAANNDSQMLAQLETAQDPPRWQPIGKITAAQRQNPELTGTGEGKLFGYFPELNRGFVQELDRATGKAIGRRWNLPGDQGETVSSYAFAHWGGVFYVFATAGGNSAVHAINRKTGKYELVREHLPYRIVGAGVSTCAPQLERGG